MLLLHTYLSIHLLIHLFTLSLLSLPTPPRPQVSVWQTVGALEQEFRDRASQMAQEKHALETGGSSSRNSQSRLGEGAGGDGGDEFLQNLTNNDTTRGNHRDHSLHRDTKGGDEGGSKDVSLTGRTGGSGSSGRLLSGNVIV